MRLERRTLKITKMLSFFPFNLGAKLEVFGFGDECVSFYFISIFLYLVSG